MKKLALIFAFLGFVNFCVADGFQNAKLKIAKDLVAQGEYKSAYKILDKNCQNNDLESCGELAGLFHMGKGAPKDEVKSQQLLSLACEAGFMEYCDNLGVTYYFGFLEKNDEKALAFFKKACDGGFMRGCNNAGVIYDNSVPNDFVLAFKYYQKACDGGYAYACGNVAVMYDFAKGVEQDILKAIKMYKKGCEGDNPHSCQTLAQGYSEGKFVEKNPTLAKELYKKACNLGLESACSK